MLRPANIFRLAVLPIVLLAAFSGYYIRQKGNRINIDDFNVANVQADIETLSSPFYKGRLIGSDGNQAAMDYISAHFKEIGLLPAGDEGTYLQSYSTMVPQIDSQAVFTVGEPGSEQYREFTMFQDYRPMVSGNGGGIDFSGEIILVGSNIYSVDPEEFRNRIVVMESVLVSDKKVDYILENGGLGALFVSENNWTAAGRWPSAREKSINTAGKAGNRLLIGNISRAAYRQIIKLTGTGEVFNRDNPFALVGNVRIKIDITFPVNDSANIAGILRGRGNEDGILIISAEFDGLGEGAGTEYFPGAVNGCSGIAMLMEIARVVSEQQAVPYKTIAFMGFNGGANQSSGARYYTEHPIFPMEKTTVIHLENLGVQGSGFNTVASGSDPGEILGSKLIQFASDIRVGARKSELSSENPLVSFIERKVPGVIISSDKKRPDTVEDRADNLDPSYISDASAMLLNFLKVDVFRDRSVKERGPAAVPALVIIVLLLCVNYFIISLYDAFPNLVFRGFSIENLYYHSASVWIRKAIYILVPTTLALILLVLIITLPYDGGMEKTNGETITNYSGYLSSQRMSGFLNAVFGADSAIETAAGRNVETIVQAGFRSLKLISVSLLLSMLIGIGRGIMESRSRGWLGTVRTTGSLLVASIPDVAVIIGIMWIYVYFVVNHPEWKSIGVLSAFVLPLIALSVLPVSYITRISLITIQDESRKDYIRFAKAKGFSDLLILTRELYPSIISNVLDAIPTLMTMMLTNLIVIEYLFSYRGIIFYLLFFYERHDSLSFVILAISVGVLYMLFGIISRSVSLLINPMKRKDIL